MTKRQRVNKNGVYGDKSDLVAQDRTTGLVEFIHVEEKDKEVILTQFHPETAKGRKESVYRKKTSPYKRDATPEEAGFVLPPEKRLGQWLATAICGNDITSSIIYTPGLVAATAGYYTPLCLLLVVAVLYMFRAIYVELVTALPLNGGTYTGILNTTRKGVAVIAACLSFLAYVATVVVSAASAMDYLKELWHGLNTVAGTIVLIVAFAGLLLLGLRESAVVAAVIFGAHMLTLALLIAAAFAYACSNKWSTLVQHYTGPSPPDAFKAIVLGFSQSMLGITGFESSANFVEHQAPGVFAKTLRNMWVIVALVNPSISILGFAVISPCNFYNTTNNYDDNLYDGICNITTLEVTTQTQNTFLALMGREMDSFLGGHSWLEKFIIVDSVIVLSGAVLTGYVGVLGLLKRMVDDDIFPPSMLARTPLTKTHYPIILFFCTVCVTLIILTWGDIDSVSGVYTLSFLSVMFLFCLSNLILKHTRRDIKRDQKAKWYIILTCMCALIIAAVGNCVRQPIIIAYTALYFAVFHCVFYACYARSFMIKAFLQLTKRNVTRFSCVRRLHEWLVNVLIGMENVPVVFFSRRLNLKEMNKAVQRVLQDELSRRLTVLHVYENVQDIPETLGWSCKLLNTDLYPHIRIDVLLLQGKFGPGAVRCVEAVLDVPPNRMFIVSPSKAFPYNVADLGSVRIIMSRRERDGKEEDDEDLEEADVRDDGTSDRSPPAEAEDNDAFESGDDTIADNYCTVHHGIFTPALDYRPRTRADSVV